MMYMLVEEASGAIEEYTDDLTEAISCANTRRGKYLVIESSPGTKVVYDSMPDITFKI